MTTYAQSTGRTIQSDFDRFHELNPIVYNHFERLALEAIKKGKSKISSKMIVNVIRWQVFIAEDDLDKASVAIRNKPKLLKINDAFTSRYARLFIQHHPEYKDYFETREIRSI